MLRLSGILVLMGLTGCLPAFETIDEACPRTLRGQAFAEEGAEPFLRRTGCYRRYVGLPAVRVDPDVQRATRGHADYLEQNRVLESTTPVSVYDQNPTLPGFTGVTSIDRLDAVGALDDSLQLGVWEALVPHGEEETVDWLAEDPYYRDVMFQPRLDSIGYSIFRSPGGQSAYFNAIYQQPPDRHVYQPIVYPIDGQTDVPAYYLTSLNPADPLAFSAVIGFPITVTVGSWEVSVSNTNPYGMFSERAKLTGPEGEVDLVAVPPGNYMGGDLIGTMIYAPVRPLTLGATYTFEAEIIWNAFPSGRKVSSTFTVADVPEPLPDTDVDTDTPAGTTWSPPPRVAPPPVSRRPLPHPSGTVTRR